MKDGTIAKISRKQKESITTLARKGCTISEVGTALGFTQNQLALILEEESHPFNTAYWNAKVEYAQRLRDFAMDVAEHSEDASVRGKMIEFLTKENSEAFEHKRLHTGYTNIKKLLSLVRNQFVNEDGEFRDTRAPKPFRRKPLEQPKEVSLE